MRDTMIIFKQKVFQRQLINTFFKILVLLALIRA